MKTNQRSANNRGRSTNARRPLNGQSVRRPKESVGMKHRIGNSGTKPKGDLRQMLVKKVKKTLNDKTTTKPTSDVKSRLGLQSKSAKLEAIKEAKAQLKAVRDKSKPLKDVKQPSTSQTNKTTSTSSAPRNRPDLRRSNRNPAVISNSNNRREIFKDNNRSALISRRHLDRSVYKLDYRTNDRLGDRNTSIKSVTTQPIIIPQPIVYQSPANYDSGPKYVNRPSIIQQPSEVLSTMGNSVLVSNLSPKITEDEIAELFGDIGPLMNIQIINSSTALITYYASQHATKAVKVYNFRLLDGIAMNVTILPASTSQNTSNQQPLYSSRMYSDSIPTTSVQRRPNYNLSL